MTKTHSLQHKFETITWGLLLLWWGLRGWLLAFLPNGTGLLVTGLLLLGLNAVQSLNGISTKGSTTIFSILALLFGGLLLVRDILQLSFEVPLFEVLMIGTGITLLVRELLQVRRPAIPKRANL